jgi:branched-chain amino acid transport system ATP-binding protein
MSLLEIDDGSMDFGGVHALDGVDLSISQGGLLGLIGPNGAGKTTLPRVLVGMSNYPSLVDKYLGIGAHA